MKLVKLLCGLAVAVMLISGCGSSETSSETLPETTAMKIRTPIGVKITEEGDKAVLTWSSSKNAEGYRVYQGSSRFSDDYKEISKEPIEGTSYVIEDAGYNYYKVTGVNGDIESELSVGVSLEQQLFGSNVYLYSPTDNAKEVNKELEAMLKKQETNQFGSDRYAVMFKPGEYAEDILVQMGFYMEVMGLGKLPTDTTLYNFQCQARWLSDDSNHNATCNFWRGVSNLHIDNDVVWAVSQATFMRRMYIDGKLSLHDDYGWSSGGFLSDTAVTGGVDSGSQQQWLSRNCDWSYWTGQNWNIVFVGIEEGKAPTETWPSHTYTAVDRTPVVSEKPYLFYEDGSYKVFVPKLQTDTEGIFWEDGAQGEVLELDSFYIAHADKDTGATMNKALAEGKNLLLTPGIYTMDETLLIDRDNTIVLGLGYATLQSSKGNTCMMINDVEGVKVGGLLFDAGITESETLLKVGQEKNDADHSSNPIVLSDIFLRVGGTSVRNTNTKSCVVVNSNDVIGDNFWVWRADHGDGVAWDKNVSPNGIIVNGDDVTMYALMVEHFQEYQTIWNGESGSVYFYQSEIPYDVPEQSQWMSHDGQQNGYPSYYVSENVNTHTAYGIGIYSFHRDAVVDEYCVMEVPEVDGMNVHNVCSVMITGNPGISHVINGYGAGANTAGVRSIVIDFQEERKKAAEE